MAEFDPSIYPLSTKGRQFEDFRAGHRFVHHWGRTITEADNVLFSSATCNWNPLYLNVQYAQAHGHSSAVVNPMLLLCIAVGMSVEDLSEGGGPFLGIDDCLFHRPVYPGDTITATSMVIEARNSKSRPEAGIVSWTTEARNQLGDLVLTFRRTNLVSKRNP
jgi:acyl dehydratase